MKSNLLLILLLLAVACGGGGGGSSEALNQKASEMFEEDTTSLENNMLSFKPLTESDWTETKVRKVLQTFALGAQVSDEKISEWASLSPEIAIEEMLSLNVFNPHFQDTDSQKYVAGELSSLSAVWSLEKDSKGRSKDRTYGLDSWNGPAEVWLRSISDPNLNPVRQRVGLYETNDHMAINLETDATSRQVFRYYDDIMTGLASGLSYEKVLGIAATSAAIATQYNHKDNRFSDGMFMGNEDFAREFHQLFFGILGEVDPEAHEKITIRNTAKALTDMRVERERVNNQNHLDDEVSFGEEEHYPGSLTILNNSISGNTAEDKLRELADLAIDESESLENLPLKIIQGLSDPHPSAEREADIIDAWKANSEKSLIAFLRRYAISDAFHHEDRFRYWSTLERLTIINQRMKSDVTSNTSESFLNGWELMQMDNGPFRPFHSVFGSMQGEETAQTSDHFRFAWDMSTRDVWRFSRYENNGEARDWTVALKADSEGYYPVKYVAEWLWQRFISDGLENFGLLERSQVYALLASGLDYQVFSDADQPNAEISSSDLSSEIHTERLLDLSITRMNLTSDDDKKLRQANERVGLAIAFIVATPYMFAQEGK